MGMKQFHWNHIDQKGKLYKVGLLHGAKTGHVLIYINSSISKIDFQVFDTKQYSLMIEEELIELNIIKHADHYEYTMEINEEVKTPLNARRKKERKKMSMHTAIFILLLIGAILSGSYILLDSPWYKTKNQTEFKELEQFGKYTLGKLFPSGEQDFSYNYVVNSEVYSVSKPLKSYPVMEGDEYMVRYLPSDPSVSEVYFVRPSDRQIQRMSAAAVEACTSANPNLSNTSCKCRVEAAFETIGYKGMISMLCKNLGIKESLQFNRDTYDKLVKSDTYIDAIKRRCTE